MLAFRRVALLAIGSQGVRATNLGSCRGTGMASLAILSHERRMRHYGRSGWIQAFPFRQELRQSGKLILGQWRRRSLKDVALTAIGRRSDGAGFQVRVRRRHAKRRRRFALDSVALIA